MRPVLFSRVRFGCAGFMLCCVLLSRAGLSQAVMSYVLLRYAVLGRVSSRYVLFCHVMIGCAEIG
jgi:hypothetical protein